MKFELVTVCGPLILMAALTAFAGIPVAYGILAMRDLWVRLSESRSIVLAAMIMAPAMLCWLCAIVALAYCLLSSGWQNALRI